MILESDTTNLLEPTSLTPTSRLPARLNAAELMKLNLPEAQFTLPGIIPVGMTMIVAKPKIGKSWFALDLGVAVAQGQEFLGRTPTKGNVLYIPFEDKQQRLQSRLGRILEGSPVPEELDIWFDGPKFGSTFQQELREWGESVKEPALVVIDTMGRAMPSRGTGQGEYEFATTVLGNLQQFALEMNLTILLVHHSRKNLSEEGDPFDQVLGSIGINGVMDSILLLQRERHQNAGRLIYTGRDFEEGELDVEFDASRGLWLARMTSLLDGVPSEQRAVVEAVAHGHYRPKDIEQVTGKSKTNVQNQLRAALDKGLITKQKTGIYEASPEVQEAILREPCKPKMEFTAHDGDQAASPAFDLDVTFMNLETEGVNYDFEF